MFHLIKNTKTFWFLLRAWGWGAWKGAFVWAYITVVD